MGGSVAELSEFSKSAIENTKFSIFLNNNKICIVNALHFGYFLPLKIIDRV